jgi:hypothetical protein
MCVCVCVCVYLLYMFACPRLRSKRNKVERRTVNVFHRCSHETVCFERHLPKMYEHKLEIGKERRNDEAWAIKRIGKGI